MKSIITFPTILQGLTSVIIHCNLCRHLTSFLFDSELIQILKSCTTFPIQDFRTSVASIWNIFVNTANFWQINGTVCKIYFTLFFTPPSFYSDISFACSAELLQVSVSTPSPHTPPQPTSTIPSSTAKQADLDCTWTETRSLSVLGGRGIPGS